MSGNEVGGTALAAVLGDLCVADQDLPETSGEPEGPLTTDALARIVELARQDMRERGFTDEQIEVLLQRKTAPDLER